MTQLSQRSDGNAYFVKSSDDLPRIFGAELGDVLSVVARKVILEIRFPDGVRPVRLIGRDGRIADNRVEFQLNQLYGGQQKYALVEVALPAGEHDARREVAQALCRYENAVTGTAAESTAVAYVQFSRDETAVVRGANAAVQADVGANVIAEAKDDVVRLADEGRKGDAVSTLRAKSQELRETGSQYNNAALVLQSTELEKLAKELEKKDMDKSMRKSFRTESFQTINQQQSAQ
jgi:Ca-activated chloride channel family protein